MLEAQWPLLVRNAQDLAEASDPCSRARLLADRVGLLARHGLAAHAAALLPEAQDAVLELDDGEAFVRLAIAEAITAYHTPKGYQTLDIFETAVEAAREHRLPELEAEAAVWLAISRRSHGFDMSGAIEAIQFALQHAGPLCESTLPRALYMAGNYFATVGLRADAQRCHHEAARLAHRAKDVQLCEAIATYPLFVELHEARAAYARGALSPVAGQDLEDRLRATVGRLSYGANRTQLQIDLGEVLRLVGRHAEAVKLFDLHLPQGEVQGMNDIELLMGRSDRAVCLLHLHEKRAASQERSPIRHALAGRMYLYHRAALLTNLMEMEQLLGRPEAAAEFSVRAADAWGQHEQEVAAFRVAIDAADLRSSLPAEPHLSLVQGTAL
ncbi:MAG TPA: hypothetical protein VIO33_26405 [Burkholderiaceae bacterium]